MPIIEGKYYDKDDPSWWDDLIDKLSPKQPPPPAPTPPSPPAAITPGTPQNALTRAQDAELANPKNQPIVDGQGNLITSFCNIATVNTLKGVGAPLDDLTDSKGNAVLANNASANLAVSSQWREVSPDEAQGLANQGKVVVGAQANPGGDGHIATVRPELMPGMGKSLGQGPLLNNIGKDVGIMPANQVFLKSKPVHYYAPDERP